MLAALLAAVVLGEAGPGSVASAAAAAGVMGATGTYLVAASVEIDSPGLPRHHELRADVVLAPAAGPGALTLTLASAGQRCTLAARLDRAGGLLLAAGQRCRLVLREESLDGAVDCTLTAGRGQVRGGRLSLALVADLAGQVRLGPAGGLGFAGLELQAPQVPVRGRAEATVEGRRDESRRR